MTDRTPIFDAIRAARPDDKKQFMPDEVSLIDTLLDRLHVPREDTQLPAPAADGQLHCSAVGIALIQRFEGCARKRGDGTIEAYPDPGTGGDPWTIGWGATGPGIKRGTVWTQAQCDARLEADLERFSAEVRRAIGSAPTSQAQFDALVSFHYNTGAIARATLTKLHKAGKFAEAAAHFGKWINAGGRPMKGLITRRAAEAALYRSGT